MSNKDIYTLIDELTKYPSFDKCVKISDRKTDEQYAMEMTVRLLVSTTINWNNISKYTELSELLDKEILNICSDATYDTEQVKKDFKHMADLLYGSVGEDVFRKYENEKHSGPFLATAFQAIAVGVFANINEIMEYSDKSSWLKDKVESIYTEELYLKNTVPGVRAIPRFKELSIWSREYFKK